MSLTITGLIIRVEGFGESRMAEAVDILRSLNNEVSSACVAPSGRVEKIFHPGNKKIQPVVPNKHKSWCAPFFKTEIASTKTIRLMNR